MDPLRRERWRLLANLVRSVEPVMAALGLAWLLLLILELTRGTTPALSAASNWIWAAFLLDFLAELLIAPSRRLYLRRHWMVVLSLALPGLRFLRLVRIGAIVRAARAMRGVRLLRTITSVNRAMGALRATMRRRGFGYVTAMTLVVTAAGAAGMYAFEKDVADPAGIHDFGTALWWTAMIMTTMGSAYWPQTVEGRILCVLLALYAFAVFGYVTATLASFFLHRDAKSGEGSIAGTDAIDSLRHEVELLRLDLADARGPDVDGRPPVGRKQV